MIRMDKTDDIEKRTHTCNFGPVTVIIQCVLVILLYAKHLHVHMHVRTCISCTQITVR